MKKTLKDTLTRTFTRAQRPGENVCILKPKRTVRVLKTGSLKGYSLGFTWQKVTTEFGTR